MVFAESAFSALCLRHGKILGLRRQLEKKQASSVKASSDTKRLVAFSGSAKNGDCL